MARNQVDTVAAIDVGTNSIRMLIAEIDPSGRTTPLDELWKPTDIGRDTFVKKRVAADSIHETCDTLKGFVGLMRDYRVRRYRAVSTSGIREAENREYVLEQIRLRTGLTVEVINQAEERFLVYKALRDQLPEFGTMSDAGTLVANIGMGGVEVSVYSEGHLKFTDYIKIGSLRLRKILADLEPVSLDFSGIMREFVESRIHFLEPHIRGIPIQYFIGLGDEIRTISNIYGGPKSSGNSIVIPKQSLQNLYEAIRGITTDRVTEQYQLHRNEAEVLLPSLIIFNHLMDMTGAQAIHAPLVTLRQGILADLVDDIFDTSRKHDFIHDIITSVWYIAEKYKVEKEHSAYIEWIALTIFDQTWRIHRLGNRERLYLNVAAILHDIGKYVNATQHDVQSHNVIRSQDIMGFSNREMRIIANLARYHSDEVPQPSHDNYRLLNEQDKIMVSKLVAVLKLAEALDLSHSQKIKELSIVTAGRELHFKLKLEGDFMLEQWNFENVSRFFEEVMGYRPVIKRKG